ncbi:hypothetical protein [Nonomuraea sp. 10N515B]|uniref:hypothetical protein n=1 Tax=Nonomuraea sp. 10N515B TaxID=3457422 RepID=UPI003FCEBB7E
MTTLVGALLTLIVTWLTWLLTKEYIFTGLALTACAIVGLLVWAFHRTIADIFHNLARGVTSPIKAGIKHAGTRKPLIALAGIIALIGTFLVWRETLAPWPLPSPECAHLGSEKTAQVSAAHVQGNVRQLIAQENRRVTTLGKGKYVTIAFLGTLDDSQGLADDRVTHQLEGAYIGQLRANRGSAGLGQAPQIRLELIELGPDQNNWKKAIARVKAMAAGPEHLVGVTGMGVSHRNTVSMARALAAANIPMVGDVLTADGLNMTGRVDGGSRINGLFRMPHEINKQFSAIDCYLRGVNTGLESALLVEDAANGTDQPDIYAKSLAAAFRRQPFGDYLKAGGNIVNQFGGEGSSKEQLDNEFGRISGNFCGEPKPDIVFYAGRAAYLPSFLGNLRKRNCADLNPITVITGSDASSLAHQKDLAKDLAAKQVRVLYVPLAHPADLNDAANRDRDLYRDFASLFSKSFNEDDLLDGWAIMAHDSFVTVAKATRNAYTGKALPTPRQVQIQIGLFTSETNDVPGATGHFTIESETGDRKGGFRPVVHSFGAE